MKAVIVSLIGLLFVSSVSAQSLITGCRSGHITNYPDVVLSFFPNGLSPLDCVNTQSGTQTCKTVVAYAVWDGADTCSIQVGHFSDMVSGAQARVFGHCTVNGQTTTEVLGHTNALDEEVDIVVVNNNGNIRLRAMFFNENGNFVNKPWVTPFDASNITKVGVEIRASLGVAPTTRFEPIIELSSFNESDWNAFMAGSGNPYVNLGDCQVMVITQ